MKISMISPVLMGVLLLGGPAYAGDDPKVTAEIMALARSQWAAEVAGKSPADQMMDTAEDYTEFNGDYPVRIDGKALNLRMWEALSSDGSKSMLGDMTERQGAGLWRCRRPDLQLRRRDTRQGRQAGPECGEVDACLLRRPMASGCWCTQTSPRPPRSNVIEPAGLRAGP